MISKIFYSISYTIQKNRTLFLLFIFGGLFLFLYASHIKLFEKEPWDFKTYYYSAKTFFAYKNPYSVQEINQLHGTDIWHPLPYHPYFLFIIAPLLHYDLKTAGTIYLVFNLIVIFYLLWVWNALLGGKTKILLLLFLLFFSFNRSLSILFNSGNISVIVAAIIWSALYFWKRENAVLFTLLIFIAMLFRVFPVLFLSLVLLYPREMKIRAAKTAIVCIIIALLPFVFRPPLLIQYIDTLSKMPLELGCINPCSYSVFVEAANRIGIQWEHLPHLIYILYVIVILLFFLKALRKTDWKKDKIQTINLFFLTYILVVPRFKDYSYILAVPVVHEIVVKNVQLVFFAFFNVFDFIHKSNQFIADYHPFLTIFIFWIYYVYCILSTKEQGQE